MTLTSDCTLAQANWAIVYFNNSDRLSDRRGTEAVVPGSTRNRVTPHKGVRGFESHPLRHPLYHTPVITTSITTHLQRLLGVSSLRLAAMWPPAVVVRITELYIDMNDTVVKCRS